jgi:hypothetical protein
MREGCKGDAVVVEGCGEGIIMDAGDANGMPRGCDSILFLCQGCEGCGRDVVVGGDAELSIYEDAEGCAQDAERMRPHF